MYLWPCGFPVILRSHSVLSKLLESQRILGTTNEVVTYFLEFSRRNFTYVVPNDVVTNWFLAKKYCEKLGGNLADIQSEKENQYILQNVIKDHPASKFYIGKSYYFFCGK